MDVVYYLQGHAFEWDSNKARTNQEKHGVTFEEAAEVFFDPFYQVGDAVRNNEQRDFIIGYSLSERQESIKLPNLYSRNGQRQFH